MKSDWRHIFRKAFFLLTASLSLKIPALSQGHHGGIALPREEIQIQYDHNGQIITYNPRIHKYGVCSVTGLDGEYRRYHDRERKKLVEILECKNGLQEGPSTTWCENGTKASEIAFKEGFPHGYWIARSCAGLKKVYEGRYVDGQREGLWIDYWDGTEIKMGETTYVNGREEGIQKEFYRSGRLKGTREWRGGQLHGASRLYYANGQIAAEVHYVNGQVVDEVKDSINKATIPAEAK